MKRKTNPFCLSILKGPCFFYLLALSFISCNSPDIPFDKYFGVLKLSDKVLVLTFGYDAVTAIETTEGIVVIDAGISKTITSEIRKRIEREFNRKDFIYLVNTHSHPDHTGGNRVFADVKIIGHLNCEPEMEKGLKNPEKVKVRLLKIADEYKKELDTMPAGTKAWKEAYCQECRYRNAYNDFANDKAAIVPAQTFGDSLRLDLGDATMDLFYFGKAHSGSDILIHVPELKMLFTGDLFFPRGRPSLQETDSDDTKRWEQSFRWLSSRKGKINTIIGGHGQIMTSNDLESFIEIMERKIKM
jgi:glyoxylase-like metal-dependent hydrolase (beta-lactamase superfamily II)